MWSQVNKPWEIRGGNYDIAYLEHFTSKMGHWLKRIQKLDKGATIWVLWGGGLGWNLKKRSFK